MSDARSNFEYDVFLSHSAKDKAVVREIAERLRTDGLEVWFDEWVLKPGDSIPAKIEEGLERSRALVLCMSAHAFGSDWAHLESGTFRFRDPLNKERRFLPLRLDSAPIKGSLMQFVYIDWRSESGGHGYAKLLQASRSLSGKSETEMLLTQESASIPLREITGDVFQTGTPLRSNSPCYVVREADNWLHRFTCRQHEAAMIWGPRMIGKTSMITRLRGQLLELGRKCVLIDLQGMGGGSFHTLLAAVARAISETLGDKTLIRSTASIGAKPDAASGRFSRFLQAIETPVLVAFDEVDTLRTGGFSNDFFSTLRAGFSGGTAVSVLISSFFPASRLLEDPNGSPWNVGPALKLSQFTMLETQALLKLGNSRLSHDAVERLYKYTGGHPFLVQAAARLLWSGTAVSDICEFGHKRDSSIETFFDLGCHHLATHKQLSKALRRFTAGNSGEGDIDVLMKYGFLTEDSNGALFVCDVHRRMVAERG